MLFDQQEAASPAGWDGSRWTQRRHRVLRVTQPIIEVERLVAMANQIGDFFAPYPPVQREEGVRNHLRNYWDPRMREALLAHLEATNGAGLLPHVLGAARMLREATRERTAYAGPPKSDTPGMSPRNE